MSASPTSPVPGVRGEWLAIAAITALGGLLRLWSIGRLGLVHFDEGIYAMAGTWVQSPRGLAGLDPTVISYAPPGYPTLVGLAYGLLGVADLSAILVSIVAGTLTIPVAGWLGYRTFGRGAGAAASAFAALSGPHIAFSRMALTDVIFTLSWLIAIGQGQRFLEKPRFRRAVALGLSVGVAQLFKYNGWLAGAAVMLAAGLAPVLWRSERDRARQRSTWQWGGLAAGIAAAVYWPWFRFVEAHGGYAALLAHQRGYMGGIATWPGHAWTQLVEGQALSGGVVWLAAGAFVAAIGMLVGDEGLPRSGRAAARVGLGLAGFTGLCALPGSPWFGALFWLMALAASAINRSNFGRPWFLVIAWLALAVLTPFYHPYARLQLPLQALGWVLMGGAFAAVRGMLDRLSPPGGSTVLGASKLWGRFAMIGGIVPIALYLVGPGESPALRIGRLLGPSDSVRLASRDIIATLPRDLGVLRAYVRPPVTFYLAATAPIAPQASADTLFTPGDSKVWAILDAAMVRQGGRARGRIAGQADGWDLVREFPTTLNLPTLLDVDPSATGDRPADRTAPLLLFRPRSPGVRR